MTVTLGLFLLLFAGAFVCEFIDAALGMGYGTILAPVLLMCGFEPQVAVPAILISQAIGGYTASVFHHRFQNATFAHDTVDTKVVFIVSSLGILATIFAASVALEVPASFVKGYIGVIVVVMGVILLMNLRFDFTWRRMVGLGLLSAFNKGLSGGGFGPVITAGQIIAGREHKEAIAATTLAEAPICTVGFLTYLVGRALKDVDGPVLDLPVGEFIGRLFAPAMFQWELVLALILGSVFVAPFGALTTRVVRTERLSRVLGVLVLALGLWTLKGLLH